MFLFQIETDGDAFANGNALHETARLLRSVADAIADGNAAVHIVGRLKCEFGNTCGAFRYVPEPEPETEPDAAACECGAARVTCDGCGARFYGCASVCWKCGAAT